MSDIIEQLRDDANYYGKVGKQYLSNSDIKVLLDNPAMFGVPTPDNASSRRRRPRRRAWARQAATPRCTRMRVRSVALTSCS
jgi:hypothetical protein